MALPSIAMTRGDQPSIHAQLVKIRDQEEEAARHLFIVCGKEPAGGFHAAWCKEDAEWYMQWFELCMFIASISVK